MSVAELFLLSTVSAEADDGGQLGSDNEFVKLDKEVCEQAGLPQPLWALRQQATVRWVVSHSGAAAADETPVHALNDMIGFQIDPDDSDSLDFVCVKNNTESKLSDIAVIDTTANSGKGISDFMKIGFKHVGGTVAAYVDGESVGTVETNIPDDELLGSVIAISNGNTTAACVTAVDYVMMLERKWTGKSRWLWATSLSWLAGWSGPLRDFRQVCLAPLTRSIERYDGTVEKLAKHSVEH